MERIESAQNKKIKWIAGLKQKQRRKAEGVFVAEGVRLCEMAVLSGWRLSLCLFTPERAQEARAKRLLEQIATRGCPLYETSHEVYKKASDTETPQGILLVLEEKATSLAELCTGKSCGMKTSAEARAVDVAKSSPEKNGPLLVVLDGVQDPGNAGTILRTADAAGADGVILLHNTLDVFSGKTVRASMGSIFHLPLVSDVSRQELQDFLCREGIDLLAAVLDEAARPYYEANYNGGIALAFGNEGKGISSELQAMAARKIFIPMFGQAESLNVSTAAALVLYEAAAVRRGFGRHSQ